MLAQEGYMCVSAVDCVVKRRRALQTEISSESLSHFIIICTEDDERHMFFVILKYSFD